MARWRNVIAHTLALGAIALATTTAWAKDPDCFGGAPEVVVRDQPQANQLTVFGRQLLWTSHGRVRSLDLDTGAVTTVGSGDDLRAVDDRHMAAVTARNQLLLLDRRSRKQRVVVDGSRTLELKLTSSSVGLHGGFAYFGRMAPEFRREEAAGFFRVPVDGGRRPERLAMEPDGETPFVVVRDAVVWVDAEPGAFVIHKRPLAARGPARAERRPFPPGRSIKGVPAVGVLRLLGDELYFTADAGIWSAALDRQEPARERVPNPWPGIAFDEPVDLVVHGLCAYFAAGGVIRRARMDSGAAPETVVAGDRLGDASLATDGRHLYWASRDGHILRAGPSAAAHVVRPPLVAKPAPAQPNRESDFAEATSVGVPVVDAVPAAGGEWPKGCLVHRACLEAPAPLPNCDARAGVPVWTDLLPRAAGLVGTRIAVRGPLAVDRGGRDHCRKDLPCCGPSTRPGILVGATDVDTDGLLFIDKLGCQGDDSRLCCNARAYGQQVRVEGTLARQGATHYQVQSPRMCQEPAAR